MVDSFKVACVNPRLEKLSAISFRNLGDFWVQAYSSAAALCLGTPPYSPLSGNDIKNARNVLGDLRGGHQPLKHP